MNRELKFRYWDSEIKQMVYSDEFNWENNNFRLEKFFGKAAIYAKKIQQFTGLNDKLGSPIYEGDILKTLEGDVNKVTYNSVPSFDEVEDMMKSLEKKRPVRNRDQFTGRFMKGFMKNPEYVMYGMGEEALKMFDEAMRKEANKYLNER